MPDFKASLTQNGVAVSLAGHTHTWTIPRGTSFPLSPAQYDLFQRTDLGEICEWDGNRWLGGQQLITPQLQRAGPAWTTPGGIYVVTLPACVITNAIASLYVQTTNNASNYWTLNFINESLSVFWSVNTASIAAGVAMKQQATFINVINSIQQVFFDVARTGTPGAISAFPLISARRIYT